MDVVRKTEEIRCRLNYVRKFFQLQWFNGEPDIRYRKKQRLINITMKAILQKNKKGGEKKDTTLGKNKLCPSQNERCFQEA